MSRRTVTIAALIVLQLLIVAIAVGPRLSAHLRGEEYQLRVAPVDPIDPFRGAYVDLSYPGLQAADPGDLDAQAENDDNTVFIPLVPDGQYWKAGDYRSERPDQAPYLACESDGWSLSCGIESWFTDQDEARRLEQKLGDGAVATIKVDDRGNAAIVALDPE